MLLVLRGCQVLLQVGGAARVDAGLVVVTETVALQWIRPIDPANCNALWGRLGTRAPRQGVRLEGTHASRDVGCTTTVRSCPALSHRTRGPLSLQVFEYVEYNACAELDRYPFGLPQRCTKLVAWQLLQAVAYLHDNRVGHRGGHRRGLIGPGHTDGVCGRAPSFIA